MNARVWCTSCTALLLIGISASTAGAVNSIVVESKQVNFGQTGVTVDAYFTNDAPATSLSLPMEIREVTPGTFTTNSFSFTVQGRVAGSPLEQFSTTLYFADPDLVNSCSGPVSQTYSGGQATPVGFFTSPDAHIYAGVALFGATAAGTDGAPGFGPLHS